jgi:hypothetical protein
VRVQRGVSRDAADMLLIVVVGVGRAVKREKFSDRGRLSLAVLCVLGSRCGWCKDNT